MSGPLTGYRIVDLTSMVSGPLATMILADQGAEVIKVENPKGGDYTRAVSNRRGGFSASFLNNNRNKRSVALNLKDPRGRELLMRLAVGADVFVQNFRKGVAGRLGLGYADLKAHNEKLIYASATGYGPEGPDSGEPSFDQLGLARSGIMMAAGGPGMPPLAIAGGVADQMGAIMLAYGVLAALLARERSGLGQEVDASHLGSMMMLRGLSVSAKLMMGFALPRTPRESAGNPLWNHYRCQDDAWLSLGMLQPDRYWADLCRAFGRPELATDERFADMRARSQNAAAAVAILDEIFASKPREEWLRVLKESEGDFILTVVNSIDDLPDDPQVRANDYIIDYDHPQYGKIQMLGMPVRLSETPGSIRQPAPEFGQHSEEVLLDLGYSWDEVTDLRKREVI